MALFTWCFLADSGEEALDQDDGAHSQPRAWVRLERARNERGWRPVDMKPVHYATVFA